MAGETQEAAHGWGGEFHFHDGTALYEAVEVVGFDLPDDEIEEIEKTHLKSPGKRREFMSGLIDGGEVEVRLNYRPGSDTDIKIRAWKALGNSRAVRFIIPDEVGDPAWQVDTSSICRGYPGVTVEAGTKMEATLRLRITGDQTQAAAA
ncbi:phage tail tube protein [Sphingosinicella sp. BN140058]|uniref:phage tail tube protein n=1 Tax=Sphingosinicella sp. BN140058 TaxID=1892855 RepID=UPI0010100C06|nr:phage tail tube protein [Sphingosinicella sp. BN140058]QAY77923.1 hypothetical protein ETR14_16385 [Sphingosinicella sp. BN140058]